MPEYGLTPTGPHIKRLDVILNEMHARLSEKWGVNTKQDPQSLLNHLLTNIADQIADCWTFAEEVYYSQYPTSAEGTSLDNSAVYGGIVREAAAKSYYRVLCKGRDGTTIPAGTIIASNTNPPTQLRISQNAEITSGSFNKAEIIIAEEGTTSVLSCMLDGTTYTYSPQNGDTDAQKLSGLAAVLNAVEGYTASCADGVLSLSKDDDVTSGSMLLSENLTTQSVSSLEIFATDDYGDILIPNGVITKIVRSVPGLESVTNVGTYVAGREEETDTELRQSYVDKIFNRSSSMIESIRSALLEQVQGITTLSVYENYTNLTDAYGRYPHSVEVVADGTFDETKLAQVILNTKAGGISTYGDHEVVLPGLYGEPITIRYNKPAPIYVWFKIDVKFNSTSNPPTNYVDLVEGVVTNWFNGLQAGDDVMPQRVYADLYKMLPGADYFDISMASTSDQSTTPAAGAYTERTVSITPRQKAVTDAGRIEVGIVNAG